MTHEIVMAGLILFGLYLLFALVLGSIKAVFTSGHPWIGLIFFAIPSCALFVWALMQVIG